MLPLPLPSGEELNEVGGRWWGWGVGCWRPQPSAEVEGVSGGGARWRERDAAAAVSVSLGHRDRLVAYFWPCLDAKLKIPKLSH